MQYKFYCIPLFLHEKSFIKNIIETIEAEIGEILRMCVSG